MALSGNQGVEGKTAENTQVQSAQVQPLRGLWAQAWLYAQIRSVPHLLPRKRSGREHPRRAQGKLVVSVERGIR
jgi:hypothetical protein